MLHYINKTLKKIDLHNIPNIILKEMLTCD